MKRIGSILAAIVIACTLFVPAFAAGKETHSELQSPAGLLVTKDGMLYGTDRARNIIFALGEDGTTIAAGYELPQGPNTGGHFDSGAKDALFRAPTALVEWMGGIVIADTENHSLRLWKDGSVKTLAGNGSEGSLNGIGSRARFSRPLGLAADGAGNLYVADSGNGTIRKMTQDGTVSTYASGFAMPAGLCWADGALFVADAGSNRIYKITNGKTELIAGNAEEVEGEWTHGFSDGPAKKATFSQPMGLLVVGDALYIADTGNSAVRVLENGRVSTVSYAGENDLLYPVEPVALAVMGETLYVADRFAGVVYSLDTAKGEYEDVAEDAWSHEAIRLVSRMGLMSGVGEGLFDLTGTVTRAQVAAVMMRYTRQTNGDRVLTGTLTHPDVPEDAWYAEAAAWAGKSGLIAGYPDGRFGGDDALTREQCVTVLYRAAKNLGIDVSASEQIERFQDAAELGEYAKEAMNWALYREIVQGFPGDLLAPSKEMTREEFAAVLCRWVDVLEK